ncbi:MAG: transcriptional regulator, partial [Clostridia bacterium]|nr:transcriptional regulator [Clostridia bacterium]
MEALFLKILNLSIIAGWITLAIVILRPLLKKAPKAITVALWALVAIRLLFPFSIESVISLIPSAETVPPEIIYAEEPTIHSGITTANTIINPVISENLAPTPEASVNPMQILVSVASVVWVVGMIAMAIYAAISYLRIRLKVRASIPMGERIRICDEIPSPFILGILRPRIYLPSDLEESQKAHVIAHEEAHLRRKDHWWKPLGFALLTVYWFHPLLWVAYILLCRDIELA